eukprot:IDg2875t1
MYARCCSSGHSPLSLCLPVVQSRVAVARSPVLSAQFAQREYSSMQTVKTNARAHFAVRELRVDVCRSRSPECFHVYVTSASTLSLTVNSNTEVMEYPP